MLEEDNEMRSGRGDWGTWRLGDGVTGGLGDWENLCR